MGPKPLAMGPTPRGVVCPSQDEGVMGVEGADPAWKESDVCCRANGGGTCVAWGCAPRKEKALEVLEDEGADRNDKSLLCADAMGVPALTTGVEPKPMRKSPEPEGLAGGAEIPKRSTSGSGAGAGAGAGSRTALGAAAAAAVGPHRGVAPLACTRGGDAATSGEDSLATGAAKGPGAEYLQGARERKLSACFRQQ
jgi:hypothetical protein